MPPFAMRHSGCVSPLTVHPAHASSACGDLQGSHPSQIEPRSLLSSRMWSDDVASAPMAALTARAAAVDWQHLPLRSSLGNWPYGHGRSCVFRRPDALSCRPWFLVARSQKRPGILHSLSLQKMLSARTIGRREVLAPSRAERTKWPRQDVGPLTTPNPVIG